MDNKKFEEIESMLHRGVRLYAWGESESIRLGDLVDYIIVKITEKEANDGRAKVSRG